MIEAYVAPRWDLETGSGAVELGRPIHGLEDPLRPGQGCLNRVVEIRQLAERIDEVLTVVDEGGDDTHGDEAAQGQPPTQARQDDHEQVSEDGRERHQQEGVGVGGGGDAVDPLVLLAEGLDGGVAAPKGLDDLLSTDDLLHDSVQAAKRLLQLPKSPSRVDRDEAGEPEHDRDHQQRGEREPAVEHEHRDQDPQHRQHAGQQGGDVLGHRLVDGVDVVGQATHQLPGGVPIEERDGKGLQVLEQPAPQVL